MSWEWLRRLWLDLENVFFAEDGTLLPTVHEVPMNEEERASS